MPDMRPALGTLTEIAEAPHAYAEAWKRKHGRKAIRILPINFPADIVYAAGALPVVVQDSREPITVGSSLLPEFYCGYTRSLVDQVARGALDFFDAFLCVDHCISLLGAYDGIRFTLPDRPAPLTQFIASMDEPWSYPNVTQRVQMLREQIEDFMGVRLAPEDLARSIRAYNHNRRLLRELYDLRRSARTRITASNMQALVKSSMVMDPDEHSALLTSLVEAVKQERDTAPERVPLHLS